MKGEAVGSWYALCSREVAEVSPTMPALNTGLSLLVVDDEATIRFALREYFKANGWSVECASSAKEGEKKIAEGKFDVAILDLRLGTDDERGGLALARHIIETHRETRTILLTAYGSTETRTEALSIGIDEVLDKPARLWDLCDVACKLVGSHAR